MREPKIQEHMLIAMDICSHEEQLAQLLQTNNKQFKNAVKFLSVYNGTFIVTDKINKFHFAKSITDKDGFIQITIPPDAYEIESLNEEIKSIIFEEVYFTEADYPFMIEPNFSTLGSIIETSRQDPIISFLPDDSLSYILGFDAVIFYEQYNLSPNLVDILSFDSLLFECDIAHGMIFKGRRPGITHNLTIDVSPGYKYVETSEEEYNGL